MQGSPGAYIDKVGAEEEQSPLMPVKDEAPVVAGVWFLMLAGS